MAQAEHGWLQSLLADLAAQNLPSPQAPQHALLLSPQQQVPVADIVA